MTETNVPDLSLLEPKLRDEERWFLLCPWLLTMSYCTAKRMEATRSVQLLEQSLQELEKRHAPAADIEAVRERLRLAQAELAQLGDCGD